MQVKYKTTSINPSQKYDTYSTYVNDVSQMLVIAAFFGVSMVVTTAMPYSNDISDLRWDFVSK